MINTLSKWWKHRPVNSQLARARLRLIVLFAEDNYYSLSLPITLLPAGSHDYFHEIPSVAMMTSTST